MSDWAKNNSAPIEYGDFVGGVAVAARPPREIRSADNLAVDGDVLHGIAVRYNLPHRKFGGYGEWESFQQGCFARSLATKQAVRLLIDHDESKLICTSADLLKLESDETDLRVKCDVPDTAAGRLMKQAVKFDGRIEMSVGFVPLVTRDKTIDGKSVRIITDAELYEISLVTTGAVPGTKAEIRSKAAPDIVDTLSNLSDTMDRLARAKRQLLEML